MTWKKWLLAGYLVALFLSFLVRQSADSPSIPVSNGWQEVRLPSGVKIAYQDIGPAEAPTLLLIHGSPMASSCFDRLVPHLEKNYRLIIPDLPGFGKSYSNDLPSFSVEAHGKYLAELIRKIDLREITAVGYSMGGGVALHLEEIEPDRIDRLVMLSSIGVQELELLGDYLLNHVIHGLQLSFFTATRELIPHFGLLDRFMLNRNYARNFFDTDQRPLRALLENWEKPLQIIHGKRDKLVPPDAAREHHRIVPQSQLDWVPGGNHIALMQKPAEVARLIAIGMKREPVADPARIKAAAEPMKNRRIDRTNGGKAVVMSLLGLSTFASEDLSCISGGILVARGVVSYSTATIGCLVGIFLSDIALFLVGRWCTRLITRLDFIKKKVDSFKTTSRRAWLENNAAKLIIASRFVPGSRVPTYVAMGASGISITKLLIWLLIAVTLWTPLLVGISAFYGEQLLPILDRHEKLILPGFLIVLILGATLMRLLALLATWKGRRMLLGKWKRLTGWEFWPASILYLFVLPTLVRLAIRYRSFTVFTAANPALPCGGFAIEPKRLSLNALKPSGNVPAFRPVSTIRDVEAFLAEEKLTYPIVLKPDEGERGRGVAIIRSQEEAETYLNAIPENVIIIAQDFIEGKEFGVFYYRYPHEETGRIYAITEKLLVTVTGNGHQTLEELVLADSRAVCMATFFLNKLSERRWEVPEKGKTVVLSALGTHSRGAIFRDGGHLNTPELTAEIDRITKHFEGFHFGRYDLKVPDAESLENGTSIKIIELNGVTSEATSMYDPVHSLFQGVKILRRQWEIAYAIGAENRDLGHRPASIGELFKNYRSFQKQNKFEAP
ncbi:MAG: alpha/beta fold hydrolase [Verrucomicrobiales bacterium]|nr:alpha/beta fold hydrolase [Verrucomicrobiales bacterium]